MPVPPRRRELREVERQGPSARTRAGRRRRRQGGASWLQRNALSVAAVSVLVALLCLGFGLLQLLNRPELPQGLAGSASSDQTAAIVGTTVALPASASAPGPTVPTPELSKPREIQASAKVIQPNYTVVSGDTLGSIATRFGTSIERIQAFNNLPDPRVLHVGTRLVIPPAL